MPPAQQRLHALHLHAVEVEDRLVDEEQLLALQGPVKLALQVVAVDDRRVHFGAEDDEAVLPRRLGLVQGDVGVTQQVVDRGPEPGRHSDARRHRQRGVGGALDRVRLSQGLRTSRASFSGSSMGARSASTMNSSAPVWPTVHVEAKYRRQPVRNLLEELVADVVPEGVVHVLEPVQVDYEKDHAGTSGTCARHRTLDTLVDHRPVRQARERAMARLVLKLARLLFDQCQCLGTRDGKHAHQSEQQQREDQPAQGQGPGLEAGRERAGGRRHGELHDPATRGTCRHGLPICTGGSMTRPGDDERRTGRISIREGVARRRPRNPAPSPRAGWRPRA